MDSVRYFQRLVRENAAQNPQLDLPVAARKVFLQPEMFIEIKIVIYTY